MVDRSWARNRSEELIGIRWPALDKSYPWNFIRAWSFVRLHHLAFGKASLDFKIVEEAISSSLLATLAGNKLLLTMPVIEEGTAFIESSSSMILLPIYYRRWTQEFIWNEVYFCPIIAGTKHTHAHLRRTMAWFSSLVFGLKRKSIFSWQLDQSLNFLLNHFWCSIFDEV